MIPKGYYYMFNTVFIILEIVGTIAFAISGAMTAINRRLDALGVIRGCNSLWWRTFKRYNAWRFSSKFVY